MSSAVNGAPSDHRAPFRSLIVYVLKSLADFQPAAIFGSILAPSGEKRTRASSYAHVVVGVGWAEEAAAPHAAVLPGALHHGDDERALGQPLVQSLRPRREVGRASVRPFGPRAV